jgi:hypothetical protein
MFMATTPRSQLVDNELLMHYHLISRCVRRAFLCGDDKPSRKKYAHRRGWLEERLFHLAKYFAVDLEATIYRRLQHLENSPEQLQPLVSGIGKPSRPKP